MSALEIKGTTLENSSYMGRSCFSDGEVPPFALFATEVEEVLLPSGVTAIGEGAFAETPLKKIVFPASLVSMGARAFYLCDMLEEADLSLCSVTASRTRFLWLLLAEEYSSSILCHLIGKRGVDEERSAEA